jgi:glycerol-3-phosphate acyltransferase PlsY
MIRALCLAVSYLLGAIPFGLLVGKLTKGIDIRQFGSGNIGASNVLRTLGPGPALLVFVLDTAKGFAAVEICRRLGLGEWWIVAGGLLSVFGHTFSVFLGFKGGKGVATALGVIIGLSPVIAAVGFGIWVVLVAMTRYISVASITAAVSVPVQMALWRSMETPGPYLALACVAAAAIVVKHIPNIRRLAKGTEPRFGQKVNVEAQGAASKGGENRHG